MATGTDPRDLESKVTPMQQVIPMQKVYLMQPVILMSLNSPENDYLFLSIISFFFFILLAIRALVFSLETCEANFLGDQRKALINSRLALGFIVSSVPVGSTLIICSIVVRALKQRV